MARLLLIFKALLNFDLPLVHVVENLVRSCNSLILLGHGGMCGSVQPFIQRAPTLQKLHAWNCCAYLVNTTQRRPKDQNYGAIVTIGFKLHVNFKTSVF